MKNTKLTKKFQERLDDLVQVEKKTKKMTDTRIADEIGISKASLSKYLNDNAEIGINSLVKIAEYFNVSFDYLLGFSDIKSPNVELKAVCEYTGLSEKAIQNIIKYKGDMSDILSTLLSYPELLQLLGEIKEASWEIALGDYLKEKDIENRDGIVSSFYEIAYKKLLSEKIDILQWKCHRIATQWIDDMLVDISKHTPDEIVNIRFQHLCNDWDNRYPNWNSPLKQSLQGGNSK